MMRSDGHLGEVLRELDETGILDDALVAGGPLPRGYGRQPRLDGLLR